MVKLSQLLLSVGCCGILATQAYAETLESSVEDALKTHPSVEAALAAGEASSHTEKEAHSRFYPTINVGAAGSRAYLNNSTSRGTTTSRGSANTWIWEGSVSLNQTIYDGNETRSRLSAAQAESTVANFNVLDVKENLALQATQSYIEVLRTHEVLKTAKAHYKSLESFMSRIQDMVDEGIADEAELAQAKSVMLQMDDLMVDFEGQRKTAMLQYGQFVGRMPDGDLEHPVFTESMMPEAVDDAVKYAFEKHPMAQLSTHQVRAAGYGVDVENSGRYPDVNGEASYLQRDQKEVVGGELKDARLMLRMDWDFEPGGAQEAREGRAKAEYKEALARRKEAIRQIESEIRQAYVEFETAKQQQGIARKRKKNCAGFVGCL